MVRNYSTDNATLSFMQIKQSSGIEKYTYNYNVELMFLYLMLLYKIEQNNLQKTINPSNISISTVSVDT